MLTIRSLFIQLSHCLINVDTPSVLVKVYNRS